MNSKNFLGIDWGSKHYGLAVSFDSSIPLGLTSFTGDPEKVLEEIVGIAKDNAIGTVVIGIPESKVHGEKQKIKIMNFLARLKEKLPGVEIRTADEKMTSKLAGRYAQKEKEHQEAARIILEDWMVKEGLLNL